MTWLVALLMTVGAVQAGWEFQQLGYLKLPGKGGNYGLNLGAVEEGAYEPGNEVIYVVGEGSNTLHVVDVSNPFSPRIVRSHSFEHGDGVARDVEVCGGKVAVALSSEIDIFPGHVHFFKSYDRPTGLLQYDGRITVGEFPDNLKFTPDCKTLVVANEGRSGLDHTQTYVNPEASVTVISFAAPGNPTERFIDFNTFNTRTDLRSIYRSIPAEVLAHRASVAESLVPEHLAIIDTNNAYLTLQGNSAIARINLKTALVDLIQSMPPKEWVNYQMDASDQDGGIHMNTYPIRSFRGPDAIKALTVNRKTYLFVADEGWLQSFRFSTHGFTWSEGARAVDLVQANRVDPLGINNATLYQELSSVKRLGRLHISEVDGINPFTGRIQEIYAFGGRGFSIYDAATLNFLADSGDSMEQWARLRYPSVFNTECTATSSQSPETLRDHTSDDMGPKPNALDVEQEEDGTTFLVVGSEDTGMIYLYTMDFNNVGVQNVTFRDIHRRGATDFLWDELYAGNSAGDAGICDMGIIRKAEHSRNETMVYVLSSYTGSLSMYRIMQNLNP